MALKYANWVYGKVPVDYLRPAEMAVLIALAIRDNETRNTGERRCYPGMECLRRMTHLSPSCINQAKAALKELGFISWEKGGVKGQKKTSNEYHLLYPKILEKRPKLACEIKDRKSRHKTAQTALQQMKIRNLPLSEQILEKLLSLSGPRKGVYDLALLYLDNIIAERQLVALMNLVPEDEEESEVCCKCLRRLIDLKETEQGPVTNPFGYMMTSLKNALTTWREGAERREENLCFYGSVDD